MKFVAWLLCTLIFLFVIGLVKRWQPDVAKLLAMGWMAYMAISFLWLVRATYLWLTRTPH